MLKLVVRTSGSEAPACAVALVSALADFINFRTTVRDRDDAAAIALREELAILAAKIWPDLQVHRHRTSTHFHLLMNGGQESVYVSFEWSPGD